MFEHLDLIEEVLRRSPFGLITDVDGTISPVAPTPQQASVSPLCHHYLSLLCSHLALVAAVSGRPAAEVKDMIRIDGMVYIGNHGLERWTEGHIELFKDTQDYSKVIKDIINDITPLLSIKGVIIEDKGITATVHYRLCPEPQSVEKAILAAIEASPQARGLRIIQERMAIDLIPQVEVNKGTATIDLVQEYNLQGCIYLGNDTTDIDAFRAIHAASHDLDFRGIAIGVISQETPKKLMIDADFTLNGVNDVERFLEWMFRTICQLS